MPDYSLLVQFRRLIGGDRLQLHPLVIGPCGQKGTLCMTAEARVSKYPNFGRGDFEWIFHAAIPTIDSTAVTQMLYEVPKYLVRSAALRVRVRLRLRLRLQLFKGTCAERLSGPVAGTGLLTAHRISGAYAAP